MITTLSKSFIIFFIFILSVFIFFIFIHGNTNKNIPKISVITNSSNLVFNNSYIFENKIYEDQPKIDYKGFVYHE